MRYRGFVRRSVRPSLKWHNDKPSFRHGCQVTINILSDQMENEECLLEQTRIAHQEQLDLTLGKFKLADTRHQAVYDKIAAKISAANPDDLVNIENIMSVNIYS